MSSPAPAPGPGPVTSKPENKDSGLSSGTIVLICLAVIIGLIFLWAILKNPDILYIFAFWTWIGP